ncbi:MAG: undecaprenyl-diphosphate phosphatase [Oscillospiraceae bacterium]|jgi:undecaprenyl-diphosphatase|nr:undecaprenyl-diphosphate phosphatase [Oscillospiraceae bacterium]
MLLNLIKAVIIGIVEGVTEWLPVSSTGHMILLDEFLRLGVSQEFREVFLVVVQLGAVLAVAVIYFRRLFPFYPGMTRPERRGVWTLWGRIFVSSVPAAVIALLFDDKIDALFFNWQTVAAALIFYGIVFILIEKRAKAAAGSERAEITQTSSLTYKYALMIGLFQLLSLIPGTSRSGATIIGAMLLGASRGAAAEYTFFLALPVMLGAGALKLFKFGFAFTGEELAVLLAGTAAAFAVSLAAVKFLVGFVKRHSFTGFGWYRIALGAVVAVWFAIF